MATRRPRRWSSGVDLNNSVQRWPDVYYYSLHDDGLKGLQLRRWQVWRVHAVRDEHWERARRKDERLAETGLKASPARPEPPRLDIFSSGNEDHAVNVI